MTDSTAITTTQPAQPGVFSSAAAFDEAQRFAKALASSTLIPPAFQGQQGFANCLVALNISRRMNMDPLMVVQNLHIIHGRPSWSSQFIIGLINGCGRFSPLRYEITGKGETLACTAVATEHASGQELRGPEVTMAMAKKEGWASKSGSKWQTMPELMIRYRAAAFWGRLYIPDLLVGIQTQEEVLDIEPVDVTPVPAAKPAPVVVSELNEKIEKPAPAAEEASNDDDEIF
jgi:hypothetical protein